MASELDSGARGGTAKLAVLVGSAAVFVVACSFASYRFALLEPAIGEAGSGLGLAAFVNAGRVLLGAGCGALLGIAGHLDARRRAQGALAEVELLASVAAASALGLAAATLAPEALALPAFGLVAATSAFASWVLVRRLDRPSRASNLAVALVLATAAVAIAFTFVFAQARRDGVARIVAWMLGDLGGATREGGGLVLALAAVAAAVAASSWTRRARERAAATALFARVVAFAAAGPLAGVAQTASRAVEAIDAGASPAARVVACAFVGAALVVGVDTGGRLLVGGFAPPFNVSVAMLAPLFLLWHRSHLRRRAGAASMPVAALEWLAIAALAATSALAIGIHASIVAAAY